MRTEIEELRKQLTLKELAEKRTSKRMQVEPHAGCCCSFDTAVGLQAVEKNIDHCRSRFKEQLDSIEKKQKICQEFESKVAKDMEVQETATTKLNIFRERTESERACYQALDTMAGQIEATIKRRRQLVARRAQQKEEQRRRDQMQQQQVESLRDVEELTAKLHQKQQLVDAAKQGIVELEVQEDVLNQSLNNIEEKLPKLEGEKKVAVSSKNFKAAAAVANNMKELVAKRETDGNSLVETKSKLESSRQQLEQH